MSGAPKVSLPLGLRALSGCGDRYLAAARGRSGWGAWLKLITGQPGLLTSVLSLGLVHIGLTTALPVLFDRLFEQAGTEGYAVAALTVIVAVGLTALVASAKERQESALVLGTNQVVERSLFRLWVSRPGASGIDRLGVLTTYPSQISQFAFVVDGALALSQVITLIGVLVWLYGGAGLIASLSLLGLSGIGALVINRIGVEWNRVRRLEEARVTTIAEMCSIEGSAPFGGIAAAVLHRLRHQEEPILRRRGVLQVADNSVQASAVVGVTVVSLLIFPAHGSSILGVLVGTRLLYGALGNLLVDYRVIRLGIPMLKRMDEFRAMAERAALRVEGASELSGLAVIDASSPSAEAILTAVRAGGGRDVSYCPAYPVLPESLVSGSYVIARSRAQELGIGPLVDRLAGGSSIDTVSNGERHRLALAIALAGPARTIVVEGLFESLDSLSASRVATYLTQQLSHCVIVTTNRLEFAQLSTLSVAFEEDVIRLDKRAWDGCVSASAVEVVAPPEGGGQDSAKPVFPEEGWPARDARASDSRRLANLLFGSFGTVTLGLGALAMVLGELGLAAVLGSKGPSGPAVIRQVGLSALGALVGGCCLFFGVTYLVPIKRLTRWHEHMTELSRRRARASTRGELVARLGSDFNAQQFEAPNALAFGVLAAVESMAFIGLMLLSTPILALVVPWLAMAGFALHRRVGRRVMAAMHQMASSRGPVYSLAGSVVDNAFVSGNISLSERAWALYMIAADRKALAAWAYLRTLALRRLHLELLAAAVVVVAVAAAPFTLATGLVAPAVLVYFGQALAQRVGVIVERLQGLAVTTAGYLRVEAIADSPDTLPERVHETEASARIVAKLASGPVRNFALVGHSGVGKSLALRALGALASDEALLLTSDIPVSHLLVGEVTGDEDCRRVADLALADRQRLLLRLAESWTGSLVLLDETTSSLGLSEERSALARLLRSSLESHRRVVVVMHRTANADLFEEVHHVR